MNFNKVEFLKNGEDCRIGNTDMKDWVGKLLNPTGFIILICTQGKAIISINLHKQVLKKGDVVFSFWDSGIIFNQVSNDLSVFYCALSTDLVDDASFKVPKDFYNYIFDYPLCRTTDRQYLLLIAWKEQLSYIMEDCHIDLQRNLLQNMIQNILLMAYNEYKSSPIPMQQIYKRSRSWVIANKFSTLLLDYCHKQRSVNFYANELCISPYYLYKTIFDASQLTPKEIIDQQVVMELKHYLANTNMSVNEIADEFSFEDPSYMNRYFQKKTGVSLTEYRRKMQE